MSAIVAFSLHVVMLSYKQKERSKLLDSFYVQLTQKLFILNLFILMSLQTCICDPVPQTSQVCISPDAFLAIANKTLFQ